MEREWNERMAAENGRRLAALDARGLPVLRAGEDEAERLASDFEYWAARCVRIKHKSQLEIVPFQLKRAQRKVLQALEEQRLRGVPIRLIVLKSRQWGCSTLISYYIMWLQLMHPSVRHSLVCAHTTTTATQLSGLYRDLGANYPEDLGRVRIRRYEGLESVKVIEPCGARVTVGTAGNPNAPRGADYTMVHLSEVAYWPEGKQRGASAMIRSVVASVPRIAESLVVMESTANGPGDYFYGEWQRAVEGKSDKEAVFAGWTDDDGCLESLPEPAERIWSRLTDYERGLWERGLALEQIWWYHNKHLELGTQEMMREYPTTASEAFCNMKQAVFDSEELERLREGCSEPRRRAEVSLPEGTLTDTPSGRLEVWEEPCAAEEVTVTPAYVAAVDVGGSWAGSDWSVITVFDIRREGRMETVAQWRGHTDIDRLCGTALALGRRYHEALLVFESNSLDSRGRDALERIGASGYPNLYRRVQTDTATGLTSVRYGFHTNRATKPAAINDLAIALRDGGLVERSATALEELTTYVRTDRGDTQAAAGCHDDTVITRAIAAYAVRQMPPRARKRIRPAPQSPYRSRARRRE